MPGTTSAHRFGPFELDPGRRRFTREGVQVWLPDRHMDVLVILIANAGHIVTKEALVEGAWRGLAITDNTIVQAVRGLRRVLGLQRNGAPYIETRVRNGYRFVAAIESAGAPAVHGEPSYAVVDSLLEPYRAFVDGRAALESLDRAAVDRARQDIEEALRREPGFPAAHIAMANACLLAFEATRADTAPDLPQLQQAYQHARDGCRLSPSSADAWGTLALVTQRIGSAGNAIAAARKALTLEPDEWRHYVRLAFVSWGRERLGAAHNALTLCPGLALAHWFAASVLVARQTFDRALDELHAGCAAQDAQNEEDVYVDPSRPHLTGQFAAVGLHVLHGLVLAATGRVDEGLAELGREAASGEQAHVYGRESSANRCYATGALLLRQGRDDAARASFREALTRVPGHPLATAALLATSPASSSSSVAAGPAGTQTVDAVIVRAAVLALAGKHEEAARLCRGALVRADRGQAGWLLPVDPLLDVTSHRAAWAPTLTTLRRRAF